MAVVTQQQPLRNNCIFGRRPIIADSKIVIVDLAHRHHV